VKLDWGDTYGGQRRWLGHPTGSYDFSFIRIFLLFFIFFIVPSHLACLARLEARFRCSFVLEYLSHTCCFLSTVCFFTIVYLLCFVALRKASVFFFRFLSSPGCFLFRCVFSALRRFKRGTMVGIAPLSPGDTSVSSFALFFFRVRGYVFLRLFLFSRRFVTTTNRSPASKSVCILGKLLQISHSHLQPTTNHR
jgi:hypothetical protein